jgi:hypothetical protein
MLAEDVGVEGSVWADRLGWHPSVEELSQRDLVDGFLLPVNDPMPRL